MAKRFNHKQLEMQLEDIKQDAMTLARRNQRTKSSMATFTVNTRGSTKLITVLANAEFDEEDFEAVDKGFTVFETSGGVKYNYSGFTMEGVRNAISQIIRKFRKQDEQIRWMEQKILNYSVKDNGITKKTRSM